MIEDLIMLIKHEMMAEYLESVDESYIRIVVLRAVESEDDVEDIVKQITQHKTVFRTSDGEFRIL